MYNSWTILSIICLACLSIASAQSGNYVFSNKANAIQWSRLDADIKEAEEGFDDGEYLGVVAPIYSNGKFALPRTLAKLSNGAGAIMAGEPTFKLFSSYWGNPNYAHKAVTDIINKRGLYAQQSQPFRADAGIKTIQYQSVWMWVVHQMELSFKQCKQGKRWLSVRSLDYAVADYMGSQIVASEENTGYVLHTLAVKRCSQFGTCATTLGVTRSTVNNKIYYNFRQGKKAIQSGQCAKLNWNKNRIIQLMYVPLIQGCIRYIVKTKMDTGEKKQKSHGESWAFCGAFLPKLDKCSKSAAMVIRNNLGPKIANPMRASYSFVINQVYNNFKCMGIKCSDFGNYIEYPDLTIPSCRD